MHSESLVVSRVAIVITVVTVLLHRDKQTLSLYHTSWKSHLPNGADKSSVGLFHTDFKLKIFITAALG